jgi:transcriptional regulator with XRE-family HTH domain
MTELQQLLVAIKRQLKLRGLSYREVAVALKLSEPSVKRLFSTGRISLERLLKLCAMLDLTLAELTREAAAGTPMQGLSPEQETELVSDFKLLLVAVCVLNHWRMADIVARYRLSETECIQRLVRLDRIGLIELLPGNRVRINVARDFDWLPAGPIRRFFRDQGQDDFLAGDFAGENESVFFVHGMLTADARARFQAQLGRLRRSFAELHEESLHAPIGQRRGTGMLLALRGWEPPAFAHLRR